MGSTIPDAWKGLPARQRDVLVSLILEGPCNGTEMHERIASSDVYRNKDNTYRALDSLRERGLVEREERDGRSYEYSATTRGLSLVHRVAETWGGVLNG